MNQINYSSKNASLRLTGYYASFFAVYGIAIPIWPRWLEGQISLEYVGIVLGVAYWLKVAVVPIASSVADLVGDRRRVLISLSSMVLIGLAILPFVEGWVLYAVVWGLAGAALSTGVPLSDGVTIRLGQLIGVEFGKVRRWGSVSFIVSSLGVGALADKFGLDAIYAMMIFASVLLLIASFWVPKVYTAPDSKKVPLLRPLKLPNFPLFLITVGLLLASHASLYGFSAIYWKSLGYSNTVITLLWIVGVLAEIAMFSVSDRLIGRFGAMPMIIVAAAGGVIRWTLLATVTALPLLVLAQLFHALTFALLYMSIVGYVAKRVPPAISASAQGLQDSLSMGIFFGLLTMLAGSLYEFNPASCFLLMAVCSGLGVVLGAILLIRVRRYEQQQEGS
ncbi:MFS transporter [Sneathiella limimaris]|uniref:MFS transporter n=1 Tax=Sneathiella limimaris TaxID=1964213 RepID=UPI00146A4678|nr:MFS transporter [Sneathiella limimaris]